MVVRKPNQSRSPVRHEKRTANSITQNGPHGPVPSFLIILAYMNAPASFEADTVYGLS